MVTIYTLPAVLVLALLNGCAVLAQQPDPRHRLIEETTYRPAHSDSVAGIYRYSTGLGGGEVRLFRNGVFTSERYSDVMETGDPFDRYKRFERGLWGWYVLSADTLIMHPGGLLVGPRPFSCDAAYAITSSHPARFEPYRFLFKRTSDHVYLVSTDLPGQTQWAKDVLDGDRTSPFVRQFAFTSPTDVYRPGGLAPTPCNAQIGLQMTAELTAFPDSLSTSDPAGCSEMNGVLRDAASGRPLEGVEVESLRPPCSGIVRTSADGSFRILASQPGKWYRIGFFASGYQPVSVSGQGSEFTIWRY